MPGMTIRFDGDGFQTPPNHEKVLLAQMPPASQAIIAAHVAASDHAGSAQSQRPHDTSGIQRGSSERHQSKSSEHTSSRVQSGNKAIALR